MKNIFKITMLVFLFASVQYANSADVVKVQRAMPKPVTEQKTPAIDVKNPVPQLKPQPKIITETQKAENLAKIKQYSTNKAKEHLRMSPKQLMDATICDFKYTLEDLGATNINVIDYFEPDMEQLKRENAKIHGWTYKPKRCTKVYFEYDNKPYYTTWCG